MFKVVSGDFSTVSPLSSFTGRQFRLLPSNGWNPEVFDVSEAVTLELLTEQNVKKLGSSLGMAALGGLTFGPAGAIVGSIVGGNRHEVSFLAVFRDGRVVVAKCDPATWGRIQSAKVAPIPSGLTLTGSTSGRKDADIFVRAYANNVSPSAVLVVGSVAALLLFIAVIGFVFCLLFGGPTSVFGWSSVILFAITGASFQAADLSKGSSRP